MNDIPIQSGLQSGAALAGRGLIASLFIASAAGKLMAPAATIGYIAAFDLPLPPLAYAGAVGLELVGGMLLAAGLWTRPVAILLMAFTLLAGLVFHSDVSNQNELIHLLKNLAVAGGLLQVAVAGAGRWSLDARSARRADDAEGFGHGRSLA